MHLDQGSIIDFNIRRSPLFMLRTFRPPGAVVVVGTTTTGVKSNGFPEKIPDLLEYKKEFRVNGVKTTKTAFTFELIPRKVF